MICFLVEVRKLLSQLQAKYGRPAEETVPNPEQRQRVESLTTLEAVLSFTAELQPCLPEKFRCAKRAINDLFQWFKRARYFNSQVTKCSAPHINLNFEDPNLKHDVQADMNNKHRGRMLKHNKSLRGIAYKKMMAAYNEVLALQASVELPATAAASQQDIQNQETVLRLPIPQLHISTNE